MAHQKCHGTIPVGLDGVGMHRAHDGLRSAFIRVHPRPFLFSDPRLLPRSESLAGSFLSALSFDLMGWYVIASAREVCRK